MFLSAKDHHTVPKHTIVGAYGSGSMLPSDTSVNDVVPFNIAEGDKSMVHIVICIEEEGKSKPGSGTLYSMLKPFDEKEAAQKGASLTITAYGKLIPEGAAGKHQYTFEFPEGHPTHKAMDYLLTPNTGGKACAKSSAGMFHAPR